MAVPRDKTAGSTEWLRKRVDRLLACPEVLTKLEVIEALRDERRCGIDLEREIITFACMAVSGHQGRPAFLDRYWARALLEEANEATQESPMIVGELAKVKESMGSLDNALELVRRVTKKNPSDIRLKQLLIKFEVEKGSPEEALKVAVEAAKADPTSWRIQRSLARLRRTLNFPMEAVRGHYEAAIRHHKGDLGLVVELGAYLFTKSAYDEAKRVFEAVRNLSLSGQERNRIREIWKDKDNNPVVFEGRVSRLAGAIGFVIAIPDNFEAFFWRSTGTSLLRERNNVEFTVGFNTQGAVARNIRQIR